MPIHTTEASLLKALSPFRKAKQIGFVPTMGALHNGHISLVSQALKENDCVVVSIFVNPTQFDNAGDLKKYPRTLDADVQLLKKAGDSIHVFAPEASHLYHGPVVSRHFNFGNLENEMEGKHRKGHFDGVGTVVSLLLKTVKPNTAYFGEKDYQQLQIIKKLVEIEQIPTKITGCSIVREPNGLAMSSRNKRLTETQFEAATLISKTLQETKALFKSHSISQINKIVQQRFAQSKHLSLEYFEIANSDTLKTAQRKRKGNQYRAFIAAFAGDIRLIDNMDLGKG